MIDNIIEREGKFRRKYNFKPGVIGQSVDIFEKIVKGQLVVICPSNLRETFEIKFKNWKIMLSVSDQKYMNSVNFLIVKENNKLTKPLSSM